MSTGSITDCRVKLVPTKELIQFINKHIDTTEEVPINVSKSLKELGFSVPAKVEILSDSKVVNNNANINLKQLREICDSIEDDDAEVSKIPAEVEPKDAAEKTTTKRINENYFYLSDLHWLNSFFAQLRQDKGLKCYLHEYFPTCELILPENEIIERNPVLEARCQKLREQQQNRDYRKMTKNVDAVLKNYPEDTIAYQMKSINSQLIAVLQFIFSVAAGFVFGFLGVELIIGNLDFGFRLLLGIMCALVIALAEIYFLAKKLNEIDDATSYTPKMPPSSATPIKTQKLHTD